MSAEIISAEGAIKSAEPGRMIYSRFHSGEGQWQTGFLIREEPKYVPRGKAPTIEQRGGLMFEGRVTLVVTLLRISTGKEAQLYECWFNYFGKNKDSFLDLANQEQIAVIWFTPKRARSITVRNGFRDLFARAVAAVTTQKAWTLQDFDRARGRVYARYPQVWEMWKSLSKG
jgi:hypothetical protein